MNTFNTLLLIQPTSAEGTNENQGNSVVEQGAPQDTPPPATNATAPAQTPAPDEPQPSKGYSSWIFILLIIVVFYFFLIRPQSKRAKDERKFREALKKGDKIVTTAGIHGKLIELDETTAVIETEGQGKKRKKKAAIAKHQSA
jgi:preprotein translocase subunit YajC